MDGADRPAERRRGAPVLGGLLVGALLAAGTAAAALGALSGGGAAPARERLPQVRVLGASQSADCAALTSALEAGRAVDTARAVACDRQESAAMEDLRRQAGRLGLRSAEGPSPTCSAVDRRAAAGDRTLDPGLALHCRRHARFAGRAHEPAGAAGPGATSFCRSVRSRLARGLPVAPFPRDFCARGPGAAASPGDSPAVPFPQPPASAGPSSPPAPPGGRVRAPGRAAPVPRAVPSAPTTAARPAGPR
ncbi:hypothetical protein [Streptomyces sp. NPDC001380]|uniref:hypothetical protein n=1 Tax=Streptomyces sp. NPDC001380 TaxID=3364566 RepID=UPI0036B22600